MVRSVLSQAHSKNIDQSVAGISWVGNAPMVFGKTSGTLGTGATTAIADTRLAMLLQGLVIKVTTAVAGGDSTLTLKVDTVATDVVVVIPEDTAAGETIVVSLADNPLYLEMASAISVTHDAVPTAGAVFISAVLEPL